MRPVLGPFGGQPYPRSVPRLVDRDLLAGSRCRVSAGDVVWRFSPSGGPGGQHANRAHTRVEAEVDLRAARGIEAEVRDRLGERLGPVIRVVVDQHRSQARNREQALDEVEKRLCEALVEAIPRKPTRPRRGAVERRLEAKRRRGARKAERRRDWD